MSIQSKQIFAQRALIINKTIGGKVAGPLICLT
jgi:hypothetical protein